MKRDINWNQNLRKRNLDAVAQMIIEYGGYGKIIASGDMPDFEKYISFSLGCSLKQARDYIETNRGASIWLTKQKRTS